MSSFEKKVRVKFSTMVLNHPLKVADTFNDYFCINKGSPKFVNCPNIDTLNKKKVLIPL